MTAITAKITPQSRVIALVGLAALLAVAALVVVRAGILGGSDTTSTPAPVTATGQPSTPAQPTTKPSEKPKVVLLPGLPATVAAKLRASRVVVVSLYAGTVAGDREAVTVMRAGARSAGANFVAVNLLDEKQARQMQTFAGEVTTPTLLVVKRPGKVTTKIEGVVDQAVVAQAAHDAGARK